MASFFDTTIGQQVEFQRVLASVGFTDSDIARVIKEPKLASTMYASIQPKTVGEGYLPDWPSCDQQLTTSRRVFGLKQLPEPSDFISSLPLDGRVKPLLHVPHPSGETSINFDFLWDKVVAPSGYTKYRWDGVKSDKRNLRLAPGKVEFTQPVWLAFDPEHGKDERPDSFWGQADIAASEVFSALIQFPEWLLAWFNGASAPNLTGYQLKYDGNWSRVPCLRRWGGGRRLWLRGSWAGSRGGRWASPSVREC